MPIKFAGLLNKWNFASAKSYADKLIEMDFFAKTIKISDYFIVAYSHRTFTKDECANIFNGLLTKEGNTDKG